MLKNIKFFVIAFAAVILFSGCQSVQVVDETKKENDAAIKTAETFLKAICAGDEKTAYALLPAQAAKHYGTDKFKSNAKEISGSFGKMVSCRFLTQLELTPPMRPLIFAVRFKRMGIEGNDVYQEILFRAVVGKVDGQNKIFIFGFL
jgi:uncharacterized protein YceK